MSEFAAEETMPARSRLRRLAPSIAAVLVGLAATASLSLAVNSVHADNEERLLRQRTREAGAVLAAAVPSVQIPNDSCPRRYSSDDSPRRRDEPIDVGLERCSSIQAAYSLSKWGHFPSWTAQESPSCWKRPLDTTSSWFSTHRVQFDG